MSDWETKREWEGRVARRLHEETDLPSLERQLMEHRLHQKKTNRMTEEQERTWRALDDHWVRRLKQDPYVPGPPLPFRISIDDPGGHICLTELAIHESFLDKHRYYAATILNKSRMLFHGTVMALGFAAVCLLVWVLQLSALNALPPLRVFLPIPILLVLGLLMWKLSRRVNRTANHVFDRENGKLHLYGHRGAHSSYDFHKLYWTLQNTGSVASGMFTRLVALDVDRDTGEVRSSGPYDDQGMPVCGFTLPTRFEAVTFWQALVRFMDRDWPMDDNVPADKLTEGPLPFEATVDGYLDMINRQRRERGFKVEGVRFEDGTAEWLLPHDDRLYIGPWSENLKRFKPDSRQFRLKTTPPGEPEGKESRAVSIEEGSPHG